MLYRYLHYLIILALSLSLIFAAVAYNHFRLHKKELANSSLNRIESKLKVMANEFDYVRQDLLYLSEDKLVKNLLQDPDKSSTIVNLSENFINLIHNKADYDQLVLIDNSGQEIIRVKSNRDKPKVVIPETKLNLTLQKIYNKTTALKPRQIYASPLELNIENNQIEVPIKAVIHFSTPIYNATGDHVGIIVIKYLAKQVLQNFKQENKDNLIQLMLINNEGYYLSNQHSEYEWAFMFKEDNQYLFSQQFPQIWSLLQGSNKGILDQKNGIFAYTSISIFPVLLSIKHCEFCNLRAIAYSTPASLKQFIYNEVNKLIPMFMVFLFIGSIILWYLLNNYRQRRDSENQVALLNKIVRNERDLFINGPTIVFNWRDQYGWPVDYVSDNIKSVLGYSPSSFIENDLSYSSIVAPEFLSPIAEDLSHARQQKLKSFELRPYQVVDAKGKRIWLRHFSTAIHDQKDNITHYYGYVNDITQLKQTEEELKKSREYVNNLLETLPDPTVVIDVKNYNILLANDSAKALYNQGRPIIAGTTCYQFSHNQNTPCDGNDDPCPIQQILENRKCTKVVHRHFVPGGNKIFVELMSRPVFDEKGEIVQIIESQRDITHHIINERRLTQQATIDPLTETYNRLKFDNELTLKLELARTHSGKLGLIMFDLDNFKMINDAYGHDVGDLVLRDVAELARDSIRKTDILARWGGEEFMILLPDTQLGVIEKIAETLRQKIEDHLFGGTKQVTASFGVTISGASDNESEIVKRVDNALYQSKNEGKNRVTTLLIKSSC